MTDNQQRAVNLSPPDAIYGFDGGVDTGGGRSISGFDLGSEHVDVIRDA